MSLDDLIDAMRYEPKIINYDNFLTNMKKNSKKIYSLDTNILINDPYAIFYLSGNTLPKELLEKIPGVDTKPSDPNNILISEIVIYELDRVKNNPHKDPWTRSSAVQAIESIRYIVEKGLKQKENPLTGITLENGAKFFIVQHNETEFNKHLQAMYEPERDQDIRILYDLEKIRKFLKKNKINKRLILVTEDTNILNKAAILGYKIEIQQYERDRITDYKKVYSGKITIELDEDGVKKYILPQKEALNKFLNREVVKPNITLEMLIKDFNLDPEKLYPNQIIVYSVNDTLVKKYNLTQIDLYNKISQDKQYVYPMINTALYLKEIENEMKKETLREMIVSEDYTPKRLINRIKSKLNKLAKNEDISIDDVIKTVISEISRIKQDVSESMLDSKYLLAKYPFYMNIKPVDAQIPYFELLLDDRITTVSVIGEQGAGKSLLALLAGIYYVYKGKVERISIIRSGRELGGESFGYLPGTEAEKMAPWKRSIWDNLIEIFTPEDANLEEKNQIEQFVQDLDKKYHIIEFLAPQFLQGRTLHRRYIIVDEAQNFSRAVLKIIQGRVGSGSKIVYLGDPKQIDAVSYINRSNSGIYHLANRLKNSKYNMYYAHYTFPEYFTKRSVASNLANEL